IGTGLSMADILAVLYGGVARVDPANPRAPERDRVILSKGHGAAAFYAALAEAGFFEVSRLETFCEDGSALAGHVSHHVPGVDFSTGSLGHGLSLGCGVALGLKRDARPGRAFVILSDGECDEGSTWEAALFAPHHGLDNLVAIVDYNKIQSFGSVEEVLELEPFAEKWAAFRWDVQAIDGHDHAALAAAFAAVPRTPGRPSVILAHTVKGRGVSFMETLLAEARGRSDVMLLTADLGFSVLERFRDALPGQYLNVGVAEQNMMGIAAGLADVGKTVFTYSIANFPTLRCLEQIRNDVCYHGYPVRVVSVGGGLTYASQGYTHHGVEDIGVMRALPGMVVIAPGDPLEAACATKALCALAGPAYLRLGKAGEPRVHDGPIDFQV